MTTELATLLAVVSGVVVLIAGVAWWWISRPAPVTDRDEHDVLPLFSGSTPLPGLPPSPTTGGSAHEEEDRDALPIAPAPPRSAPIIREFKTGPASAAPTTTGAPAERTPAQRGGEVPVTDGAGVPGTMVEGHTLRFGIPAEGTLQFLPGRLEIRSGLDAGREIRFVRTSGGSEPEVTFGRIEGEPYRHIQLRDRTVSRHHARMRWCEGTWSLENQSTTNPVVHNGRELGVGEVVALADGDRIEMGEVQFTYRLPL